MKITTRAVYQMTDNIGEYILLEEDSYEHDGPVSEAKGGGSTTTVQKADPWEGVQPYLKGGYEFLNEAAGNVPSYYPGQTYADFDPAQVAGMQGMMDYAMSPYMNQMLGGMGASTNWGMTGAIDPSQNAALGMAGGMYDQFSNYGNNPAYAAAMGNMNQYANPWADPAFQQAQNMVGYTGNLANDQGLAAANQAYGMTQGFDPALANARGIAGQANSMVANPYADPTIAPWIEAATRPLTQNFRENVLPGIADQAEMYGGAGSRTGLAEGIAARSYLDAAGDISANVYNSAFDRALNQQLGAGNMLAGAQGQNVGQQLQGAGMVGGAYNQNVGNRLNAGGQMTGAWGQGAGLNMGATGQMGNIYGQMGNLQQGAAGQFGTNYGDAMNMMSRSTAMAPSAMQAGMMPWQTMQQVGGMYQGQQQAAINDAMARYNFNQTAPYDRYKDYINTLQGTPWGSSSTTGPNPNASNPLMSGLGGAMMGSMIPGMAFAGGFGGGTAAAPTLMSMGPLGWAGLAGLAAFGLS